MTKQSALLIAAVLVLALMAGVASQTVGHAPAKSPTQIVVQIGTGAPAPATTTAPPVAPTEPKERG